MQISLNLAGEKSESSKKGVFGKLKASVYNVSIWNCFILLVIFMTLLLMLYAGRAYTGAVLLWLEKQDTFVIYTVIVVLFTVVSFPISVGYIVIVIATGYFFGLSTGLCLSIVGANVGIFVAHNVMKMIGRHSSIKLLLASEAASAIIRVISGSSCFKIVFCARLTPIPFGIQNGIFAVSDVRNGMYHIASLLGLIPGQFVGTYVGSSLRSMQDVLDNQQISPVTYFLAAVQLIFAGGLLVWIGSLARKELARALTEADGKLGSTNIPSFNLV